jgi:hypothetical protein
MKEWIAFQEAPHRTSVEASIALSTRRPHRRSLGSVEHSELNPREIGCSAHYSAKRIDFAHDGSLGNSPDRWIARHLTDRLEMLSQEQRARSAASRQRRGFDACMASSDHDDVVAVFHHADPAGFR